MTDHQSLAQQDLDRYNKALQESAYQQDRVIQLQARVENATGHTPELVWTGWYVGRAKDGSGYLRTKDKEKLSKCKPEMVAEPPNNGTPHGGIEAQMAVLIDEQKRCEELIIRAEIIHDRLYTRAQLWCTEDSAKVLQRRHLLFFSFAGIAEELRLSIPHVKRLYYGGLEEYGEKLAETLKVDTK